MTVRIDSDIKSRFDELCGQFGMSANTAINVFVNAVVRTQSIPFEITSTTSVTKKSSREDFMSMLEKHRQSLDPNEPEMTLEEINEEIRLARVERKNSKN